MLEHPKDMIATAKLTATSAICYKKNHVCHVVIHVNGQSAGKHYWCTLNDHRKAKNGREPVLGPATLEPSRVGQ